MRPWQDMTNYSFSDITITGARKAAIGVISMVSAQWLVCVPDALSTLKAVPFGRPTRRPRRIPPTSRPCPVSFWNVSIVGRNVATPLFIKLGNRVAGEDTRGHWAIGSISDVNLTDVRAVGWGDVSRPKKGHSLRYTATIEGLDADHRVGPIVLENFELRAPGGGTAAQAEVDPPISALEHQPRYNGVPAG